jgi:hypothetical protein
MIPVFYENPEDRRQPHCWIDPNKVLRVTPIYGEKDPNDNDTYFTATPGNPKAELFQYRIHYCDGTTYISGTEVIDEAFQLKGKKLGFQMPKSKDRPEAD